MAEHSETGMTANPFAHEAYIHLVVSEGLPKTFFKEFENKQAKKVGGETEKGAKKAADETGKTVKHGADKVKGKNE